MRETSIGMLIFPEFQLLDVAGPLDMFASTECLRPVLVGATCDPIAADGLSGVAFTPDTNFARSPPLDVLFVPGGSGIAHAISDPPTLSFLRSHALTATYITSVCTGALVLGAAGLLHGYRAATHWRYMDLLPLVGAEPVDERVVRDRNRITSGGVTAGIDFGLVLVAEIMGRAAAEAAQLSMQYAPAPPFQAGHPTTAPQPIVEELRKRTGLLHESREKLLRKSALPSVS